MQGGAASKAAGSGKTTAEARKRVGDIADTTRAPDQGCLGQDQHQDQGFNLPGLGVSSGAEESAAAGMAAAKRKAGSLSFEPLAGAAAAAAKRAR